MTDIVQKLVGALEAVMPHALVIINENHPATKEARAALSEAKAGGWVAVPVEPTPEMIHEVEHAARLGAVWTAESVYKAMLAARPLPNPPKGEV